MQVHVRVHVQLSFAISPSLCACACACTCTCTITLCHISLSHSLQQLKNQINALFSSRPGGTKSFNLDGIDFGWRAIQGMFARECERRNTGQARMVPKLCETRHQGLVDKAQCITCQDNAGEDLTFTIQCHNNICVIIKFVHNYIYGYHCDVHKMMLFLYSQM